MMRLGLWAAAMTLQPLVSTDVLEPSVQNEVDHALSLAPTNAPSVTLTGDYLATNGLNMTELALKLVSSQRADGRWMVGTNDVTRTARAILEHLAGWDLPEQKEETRF